MKLQRALGCVFVLFCLVSALGVEGASVRSPERLPTFCQAFESAAQAKGQSIAQYYAFLQQSAARVPAVARAPINQTLAQIAQCLGQSGSVNATATLVPTSMPPTATEASASQTSASAQDPEVCQPLLDTAKMQGYTLSGYFDYLERVYASSPPNIQASMGIILADVVYCLGLSEPVAATPLPVIVQASAGMSAACQGMTAAARSQGMNLEQYAQEIQQLQANAPASDQRGAAQTLALVQQCEAQSLVVLTTPTPFVPPLPTATEVSVASATPQAGNHFPTPAASAIFQLRVTPGATLSASGDDQGVMSTITYLLSLESTPGVFCQTIVAVAQTMLNEAPEYFGPYGNNPYDVATIYSYAVYSSEINASDSPEFYQLMRDIAMCKREDPFPRLLIPGE